MPRGVPRGGHKYRWVVKGDETAGGANAGTEVAKKAPSKYGKPPKLPRDYHGFEKEYRILFHHKIVQDTLWTPVLEKLGWTSKKVYSTQRHYFTPSAPFYDFDSFVRVISFLRLDKEHWGVLPEVKAALATIEDSYVNNREPKKLSRNSSASTKSPAKAKRKSKAAAASSNGDDDGEHDSDNGNDNDGNNDDDVDNEMGSPTGRRSGRKRQKVSRFSTYQDVPTRLQRIDLQLFHLHIWPVLQSSHGWTVQYRQRDDISDEEEDSFLNATAKLYMAPKAEQSFPNCRQVLEFLCTDYDYRQLHDIQQALMAYEEAVLSPTPVHQQVTMAKKKKKETTATTPQQQKPDAATVTPRKLKRPHKFSNPIMKATIWGTLEKMGWKTTVKATSNGTKRTYFLPDGKHLVSITQVLDHVRKEEPWCKDAEVLASLEQYQAQSGHRFVD